MQNGKNSLNPGNEPLISIGMPVYNEERYLAQALDSLLAQDFRDFEIIISDNASTDITPKICSEYVAKDNRIKYYRNDQNVGSIKNYNRVCELASGEYFVWAGGHDLWDPSFLSSCLEVLERDESIVLCYSQPLLIDEDNNPIVLLTGILDTRGNLVKQERLSVMLWCHMGCCNPVCGVIRLSALRATSMLRPIIGSDTLLLCELSTLGAFAYLPDPLFHRRKTPGWGDTDIQNEKCGIKQPKLLPKNFLYWRMLYEYISILPKHFDGLIWKFITLSEIVTSMFTRYSVRASAKTPKTNPKV